MGSVVCLLEYSNKDKDECFKNCSKFISHKEILLYFCSSYIKKEKKKNLPLGISTVKPKN